MPTASRLLLLVGCLLFSFSAAAESFLPPPGGDIDSKQLAELKRVYNERLLDELGPAAFLNRLVLQRSPYLARHGSNPINWRPWSDEIFALAAKTNKPIFLSIGYSTCHWCHVMEQDSFVKTDIAELLNQHFIAVKVDREMHPDVDEFYTTALDLMTGSSGWPVTAVLNSKGEPWFIQSFLPHNKLKQLLTRLSKLSGQQRTFMDQSAGQLMALVNKTYQRPTTHWQKSVFDGLTVKFKKAQDDQFGGFAGAPKFPAEAALLFALQQLPQTSDEVLRTQIERQLSHMAGFGLYDHINGGFHRYTTDRQWLIPHYEKMLYNQAQLLMVYSRAAQLMPNPEYLAVISETVDFVKQWLYQDSVGFFSAIDAVYQGLEGSYYLYTPAQLDEIPQTLRNKAGLVSYPAGQGDLQGVYFLKPGASQASEVKKRLHKAKLPKPYIDKKVITAWNGLMVWALVEAYGVTQDSSILKLSIEVATGLWQRHFDQAKRLLYRMSIDGEPEGAGTLEDHAYLAMAFIRLSDIEPTKGWLDKASVLAGMSLEKFHGEEGFSLSQRNGTGPAMLAKTADSELLNSVAVMLEVLYELHQRTGKTDINRQMKSVAKNLRTAVVSEGLNHLYAAKVLSRIEVADHAADQYFAAGHGRIRLTDSCLTSGPKLTIALAEGWHINNDMPLEKHLRPTAVHSLNANTKITVKYPQPDKVNLGFQQTPLLVYQGQFELPLTVSNRELAVRLAVDLQACSDKVCLLPQKRYFYLPQCAGWQG